MKNYKKITILLVILVSFVSSCIYTLPLKAKVMEVTGDSVRVREKPTTESPKIIEVYKGDQFLVVGKYKNWYQVKLSNEIKGWIREDFLKEKVERKKKNFAYKVKRDNFRIRIFKNNYLNISNIPNQEKIVRIAYNYLGVRYRWGGRTSRGFDCSGFVRAVYSKIGINLPHSAREQFKIGRPVSKDQLRPGDRVFFSTYRKGPSHVGIYIGNGKFIHASSSRRHRGVTISSLNDRYYSRRYIGARR